MGDPLNPAQDYSVTWHNNSPTNISDKVTVSQILVTKYTKIMLDFITRRTNLYLSDVKISDKEKLSVVLK